MSGCRFNTENTFPPLDAVEIDVQDALLAQALLQNDRQDQFLGLAKESSLATQKKVFANCCVMVEPPTTLGV